MNTDGRMPSKMDSQAETDFQEGERWLGRGVDVDMVNWMVRVLLGTERMTEGEAWRTPLGPCLPTLFVLDAMQNDRGSGKFGIRRQASNPPTDKPTTSGS